MFKANFSLCSGFQSLLRSLGPYTSGTATTYPSPHHCHSPLYNWLHAELRDVLKTLIIKPKTNKETNKKFKTLLALRFSSGYDFFIFFSYQAHLDKPGCDFSLLSLLLPPTNSLLLPRATWFLPSPLLLFSKSHQDFLII